MTAIAHIDLVSIGRANLDLYAQDIGADFRDVTGFDAMVGGSPTNIAIGVSRLGLTSTIVTAVGDDLAGDFVIRYLSNEGVDVSHVARIAGKRTSLALLGVQPPDRFPLVFYRDDPADIYVTPDVIDDLPLDIVNSVQVSGNALSRGPCAAAAERLLRKAADRNIPTFVDLDLRPTEWGSPDAFGVAIRAAAHRAEVLIGTEDEFAAALLPHPAETMATRRVADGSQDRLLGEIDDVANGGPDVVIVKKGPRGATIVSNGEHRDVAGFPVTVLNTVGAGDAFAAGLIQSRLRGLGWERAVEFANACGAIVVTRHGCSSAFPTQTEVSAFLAERATR